MMPNLLKVQEGIAEITWAVEGRSISGTKQIELKNLITNLDSRSSSSANKPWGKNGWATHDSCFRIDYSMVENNKIAFTIDLKDTFFIHAILLVEDVTNTLYFKHTIFIGIETKYQDNPKCLITDPDAKDKHGQETFCNMEGQYITFEFDMTALTDGAPGFILCSLGIMGTKYDRSTVLASTFEV